MSNEDLLKPRYKVIADFPNSSVRVNDVLEFKNMYPYPGYSFIFGSDKIISPGYLEDFPHLFKKLEWWEQRKIEDMPEYNKVIVSHMEHYGTKEGQIIKVSWRYGADGEFVPFWTTMNKVFFNNYIVPSTKEEYLSGLEKLESMNK